MSPDAFPWLLVSSQCTFTLFALERTSAFSLSKSLLAFGIQLTTVFLKFLLLGKGNTGINKINKDLAFRSLYLSGEKYTFQRKKKVIMAWG